LKKILLIGGGSHCVSVIDSIYQQGCFVPAGILDIPSKVGSKILDVPIIGSDDLMEELFHEGITHAFITLGSIGANVSIREKLYQEAKELGFQFPTIIDPTSIVSRYASLEEGIYVGKGAIVNTNAVIGKHSIINTGTIIDHDGLIGDFVHIAPGATLSGGVTIGNRVHIGTNSTIIQSVTIGSDTLVGAGSVVLKNIGSNKKAYGNPCKEV